MTLAPMEFDLEELDERMCPGCRRSAITDTGGLVVAFGSSFFHVECFKCAKCSNKVTADTNLLLLSDGSPICANCSYCCNICHLPILDEAIMTGDDAYHAHCFKCKLCKAKIDEVIFAKTSQGIYCMNCHNERMIKIRKHAQKKAERGRSGRERNPTDDANRVQSASTATSPLPPNYATSPSTPVASTPTPQVTVSRPVFTKQHPSTNTLSSTSGDEYSSIDLLKRRSIGSALYLANFHTPPLSPRSLTDSPVSTSFTQHAQSRSATPPGDSTPSSPSLRDSLGAKTINGNSLSPSPSSETVDQSIAEPNRKSLPNAQRPPDDTLVIHPPLRTSSTLDGINVAHLKSATGKSLSPLNPPAAHPPKQASLQNIHNLGLSRSRSVSPSRSISPSHSADVPHGIESGTDTEEGDVVQPQLSTSPDDPPPPPPKELTQNQQDIDTSLTMSQNLDEYSDSTPLKRVSHSTFIAPALPPIRFSLSNGDFSEMFRSNGGIVPSGNILSLRNLEQLARISESDVKELTTPPLTDMSFRPQTPSNESTSFHTDSTLLHSSMQDEDTTNADDTMRLRPEHESSRERSTPITKLTRKLSKGRKKNKDTKDNSPEVHNGLKVTISGPTEPPSGLNSVKPPRGDPTELVIYRLKQALSDAKERGAQQLRLEPVFVEAIVQSLESRTVDYADLKTKFDGIRRTSKQYMEGLTVAQAEYDKELKARRDAEAEVTRLRVLLSGQAVRLTTLAGDSRRQEMRQQMTKDLKDNLSGLEHDLSKLRAERDMTLAEVEELSATKGSDQVDTDKRLGRSLTMRLDTLKVEYERDLVPLISQREVLAREIQELKGVRETFLEETTVLNARNEELAQLSAQYSRRMESSDIPVRARPSAERLRSPSAFQTQFLQTSSVQVSSIEDDTMKPNRLVQKFELDATPPKGKFIPWSSRGGPKSKETMSPAISLSGVSGSVKYSSEHNFQQLSVLRFTRCDHCGDKMWGSQLRCNLCNISIHVRCVHHISISCASQDPNTVRDEASGTPPPSMFGRDLSDQARADAKGGDRRTPVIVDKCIEAVETLAMDYEGIYRKTGGSSQSKAITVLFERGDYSSFDLQDTDRFNDICSVTSVLKTYFRTLPDPLLTYDLHDQFMAAVENRDPAAKSKCLLELINRLPHYHYYTLRALMLHLHHVRERHERNLMTARNLGVVFGPTLMRSRDPAAEFSDMAGKALTVEWLVENATLVFTP